MPTFYSHQQVLAIKDKKEPFEGLFFVRSHAISSVAANHLTVTKHQYRPSQLLCQRDSLKTVGSLFIASTQTVDMSGFFQLVTSNNTVATRFF